MGIIEEVKGLYKIISIDSFEKVIHKKDAISPGVNEKGERTEIVCMTKFSTG